MSDDLERKKALYEQLDAAFDRFIDEAVALAKAHRRLVADFPGLLRVIAWGKIDRATRRLEGA